MEQQVLAAIQGAGASYVSPGVHAIADPGGGATVFVMVERTKKREFTGIAFVCPLAAGDGSGSGSVAVDWLPALNMAPESADHRAAIARRAATEQQSGDPAFDAAVWIESDARPREVAPVLAIGALRRAAIAALADGVAAIELHNGKRACLRVVPRGAITDPAAIARAAAHARALRAALPAFRSTAWRLRLGPAGLLIRVSFALVITCLLAALTATDAWETVTDDLAWHAAAASAPLYALFLALARWRARRSSEGVFRFWFAVITGLVWVPTGTVAAAYAANAGLDTTLAIRTVHLVSKREVRGKNTFLSARIAPWPPLTKPVVMGLQRPTYRRLPASGPIRARIGDGWLGYTWIDDLEPVD